MSDKWIKFKKKWRELNPPNHQGYYECYICGRWIEASETTLDHIIPRSRRPDLVCDADNVMPCCWSCNSRKGSQSLDKLV